MTDSDTAEKWHHEASSMFNDPSTDDHFVTEVAFATTSAAASWETTKPADISQAGSCSNAARTFRHVTIDDTSSVSPGAKTGAPRSRAVVVGRSILEGMMHLPRNQAAQSLGLCSTTFKKVCRRAGVKKWPYRRALLGTTHATPEPTTFSSGSSAPSAFQETPHRTYFPPGRCLSASSSVHTASPPMLLPPCHANLPSQSFASASSSSSMPAAAPFMSLDAFAAHTPQQRCTVVAAVLDYLDTLSSGCAAAEDTTALHLYELEAVVDDEIEAVVDDQPSEVNQIATWGVHAAGYEGLFGPNGATFPLPYP
ncbi:hypothetical protein T484DRAFT_1828551 [Baffinella frigidus]|nr:hypothetical protein T484DRAFT_1828551 [Cryptophyta sp. CCMP2293]